MLAARDAGPGDPLLVLHEWLDPGGTGRVDARILSPVADVEASVAVEIVGVMVVPLESSGQGSSPRFRNTESSPSLIESLL